MNQITKFLISDIRIMEGKDIGNLLLRSICKVHPLWFRFAQGKVRKVRWLRRNNTALRQGRDYLTHAFRNPELETLLKFV